LDKAKPNPKVMCLNLVAVEPATIQVIKLPVQREVLKIRHNWFLKILG
jgi:hypothetical protein